MHRDFVKWLRAGLGDFTIVGCWWRKKTGAALLLCTSSVTKSIYKSLYSLGNWATIHIWGYSSKQKLVVRWFSRMFPDVSSLPIHVDLTRLIKYCIDKKAPERSVTFQGVSATFYRVQLRSVPCISSLRQSVKCAGRTILWLQASSEKKCWTSDVFH